VRWVGLEQWVLETFRNHFAMWVDWFNICFDILGATPRVRNCNIISAILSVPICERRISMIICTILGLWVQSCKLEMLNNPIQHLRFDIDGSRWVLAAFTGGFQNSCVCVDWMYGWFDMLPGA
jgi:hypothetical protein